MRWCHWSVLRWSNCGDRVRIDDILYSTDTQCLEGATLGWLHLYDVGKQALDNGVIQAYDMSTECIITKLRWALKHADSYANIREIMHTDYYWRAQQRGKVILKGI